MSADRLLKTSVFVYVLDSRLCNDLQNLEYHLEEADVSILQQLAASPATLQSLAPALQQRVNRLIDYGLIVDATADESGEFIPHRVDVETCRQCNARCQYCPQSVSPKERGVMSLELFDLVLSALGDTVPQWIALNHYGEPLLDPFFRERVERLRERRYPLHLFTNGTLLNDSLVEFLGGGGLYDLVFNFPSIDKDEWCEFMQMTETSYKKARHSIERCLSTDTANKRGVTIAVNAISDNLEERAERIRDHFSAFGPVRLIIEESNSRTGSIVNKLVRIDSHSAKRLYGGCDRASNHLHVSWEGKVFLCCQDYEQKIVLGDLTRDSIASIMSSELARQLRAEIFGLVPMQAGRICLNCNKLRSSQFETF